MKKTIIKLGAVMALIGALAIPLRADEYRELKYTYPDSAKQAQLIEDIAEYAIKRKNSIKDRNRKRFQ